MQPLDGWSGPNTMTMTPPARLGQPFDTLSCNNYHACLPGMQNTF